MPELGGFRPVAGGYDATSHRLYAASCHMGTEQAILNKQARVDDTWTRRRAKWPDVRTSDRIIFEVRVLLTKVRALMRVLRIMRIRTEVRFQYAHYALHTYANGTHGQLPQTKLLRMALACTLLSGHSVGPCSVADQQWGDSQLAHAPLCHASFVRRCPKCVNEHSRGLLADWLLITDEDGTDAKGGAGVDAADVVYAQLGPPRLASMCHD